MSDRAETRGPATRRRRTTIPGGANGAASVKQAKGHKWSDHGEKPPQYPAKAKTDEVLRHASNNGNAEPQMSGQQRANVPRGQKSAVEDISDRLRYMCPQTSSGVIEFCSCYSV